MWQQILQQAMANGNSTFNTALANSMNGNNQQTQVGGKFSGKGIPGMEPVQGEQGGQSPQTGAGVTEEISGSDERTKEPTQKNDMISEVAEMINNYKYHYKPGVGEDPGVEYSGPKAQELLQVDGYRSCVFEGEDGLLKVNTGRLALVNAGMIADLSKRLLFLESFVEAIMGGLPQGVMPDVE
jgi:hypothetical protein